MNQLHVYQTRTSTKFHTFTGPPVATPRQVLYGIFETAPHASIEQLGLILSRAAGHSSWLDADIPVDFSALLASDRIFVNPIVKPMFIHFPDGPSQELVVDQRQPLQDVLGCLGWFSAFAPIGNRRSALNLWRSAGEQTDASELFLTRIYAQPSSGPQHHVEQSPSINVAVGDSRKEDAQINIDDTLSAIETVLTEALKSEIPDRHMRRLQRLRQKLPRNDMLCELIDALDGLDCSDESFEDCADEIFQIIKDINEELHPRSRRKPKPRKRSKPTKMAPSSQGPLVTVVNEFQASMRESARRLLSMPGSTYQRPE